MPVTAFYSTLIANTIHLIMIMIMTKWW